MNRPFETRKMPAASREESRAMPMASTTPPLLEEGAAFEELTRRNGDRAGQDEPREAERFDIIVVGGGQAGLSVGHHLARLGLSFVILEAHDRVGDSWRQRWDSLRLFTPARFDSLDGMRFPAPPHSFPTKDEMADYLAAYAARFQLPVRTGVRVERLTREGDRYVLRAGNKRFEADHVVVAMASYQRPRVPRFAADLDPNIVQIHSADYRRPSQLPPGDVLVVGAANSGAEIAMDLTRAGRKVRVSGKAPGEIPFDVENPIALRVIVPVLFRVIFHRVLTVDTPMGRNARPKFLGMALSLIRTKTAQLAAAGVTFAARTEGVTGGKPRLADGTVLDVSSVVWCTGYHNGREWIDLPVFDSHGEPIQYRGVVAGEPGLYFVGQHFLHSPSSAMVHGVGRDARRVAEAIGKRLRAPAA
jgi:putative flavoprotein involved in K+ transport